MRDLRHYREKRHPERTPEPFGDESRRPARPPGAPGAFVVQQHAARSMHWDLRLEIEGVLVSWAVPKGPSLDPAVKRLAVRTEDHPLEYADFEGVIPPGNYGAGAMIVWDRGIFRCADGSAAARGLEVGKLDLLLEGHKLRGRFALVRTRRGEGREWLLIAKGAAPADGAEIAQSQPASVLSGLSVEDLARGASRSAAVEEALRRAGAPRRSLGTAPPRPMLASTADAPFSREGWLFEQKYDGVRVIASKRSEEVHLFARTGAERSETYPEIACAVAHLPVDAATIDGEIVALDEAGRVSFERLQRRWTQTDPEAVEQVRREIPIVYHVFDLLAAQGFDARDLSLARRKQVLSLFAPRIGFVRFTDHVEREGEALFRAAVEHGLEGVVAKRADSRYEAGRRSKRWVKIKVPRTADLAIVGYLRGRASRRDLGSLMLAWAGDGTLRYAGNVGSGLDERSIREILEALEPVGAAAFEGAPPPSRAQVYVEPALVCEVRFSEVTSAGLLRQPVFLRLRADKAVRDADPLPAGRAAAEREASASVGSKRRERRSALELTRLEKVFWPGEGTTKGDLLAYYEAVWPWLAPYLRDRPVVLKRYPDGIEGKSFFQKNAPGFTPDWAVHETIDGTDYFVCNDLRTLLYVVNSGAIPLHVWSARLGSLEHPDWLVLDLDPKRAPFRHVVEIARHVHRLLAGQGAPHFVKTSGQDGLHVLLPLGAATSRARARRRLDHEQAKALGEVLARVVCAELPEIATITRSLSARGGRVYVDYLQNGRGKLIAAPFSVRPRAGAPVSMPLAWSQVSRRLDPTRWNLRTVPKRLRERGDSMKGLLGPPVRVEALLVALTERLEA